MRRGLVVTVAFVLTACPPANPATDGGSGGGAATGGGGAPQGGGQGGSGGGAPVPGDSCANAIELPAQGGTMVVDTSPANDDSQGGCAYLDQTGGKELVFHVNLPSPRSVTFSSTGDSSTDPVIYVRGPQCAAAAALACADGTDVAQTEVLFLPYAQGDLYFFVDGWDAASSGGQTVSISFGAPVPPPSNDSCAGATPLTFTANRASASGDTTGANNSNALSPDGGFPPSPSCSMTAPVFGQDVVYAVTVAQAQNLSVTVTTGGDGGLDPVVYVRTVCDSIARADELTCGGGTFTLSNLDAGTYYLWVDGLNGSYGPFDLQATLTDYAPPPVNDACVSDGGTGAIALPMTGGTVSGTLIGATSDIAASCGSGGSPDVAYTVTTTQARDLIATVSTMDPAMQPVVFIRQGCGTNGFDTACGFASGAGGTAVATGLNLPPGTWVIWVESLTGSGAFTLDVVTRPASGVPANDLCTGAIPVLSGVSSMTVTGDTRPATDNISSAFCSVGAGADVFYSVTLPQARRLEARVTPVEDGGGYFPSVHLRGATACLADGGSIGGGSPGCANAGAPNDTAELIVAWLDAGTYYLVVDGLNGTKGAFSLDLATSAPTPAPVNATCSSPQRLTFVNGVAEVQGSTRGGGNEHSAVGSCSGAGPDVAFDFLTPDGGRLDGGTVNVKAVAWSNNAVDDSPVVYVQRGCFPDAGAVLCDPGTIAAPYLQSRVNAWGLRGGLPYTVWIDDVVGELGGVFTLRVSMATAPPANDACPGAVTLPLNTTVAGSTLGAGNHFSGTVAADGGFYTGNSACGNALPGADVVYRITAAAAGTYVVRAQPERGFNVALGVTTACARGSCLDTVDSAGENLPEQLTFTAAAGATYFVTVDSNSDLQSNGAARGGFVLGVQSP